MTITHIAHLIGGPEDGNQYAVEEDSSLEPRYKGPRLALVVALSGVLNEFVKDSNALAEVTVHGYLRELMPAADLSTMTENHWRYRYAGPIEGSTP